MKDRDWSTLWSSSSADFVEQSSYGPAVGCLATPTSPRPERCTGLLTPTKAGAYQLAIRYFHIAKRRVGL